MQEDKSKDHTIELKEKCLSCGKTFNFREIMLWEGKEIKCPNCGALFLIVK